MRVLIAGDVHGRHERLAEFLRQAQTDFRIAAAIQVGDFGFYREALLKAEETGLRYPVPLHVIDGNHEDHLWLHRTLRQGADRAWLEQFNLIYQPRGSVAPLGGSKVGFLGGALHVDRPQKHNEGSGFPNYILRQETDQAAARFNQERPALIVTHSCPARLGIGMAVSATLAHSVAENIVAAGFDPGPDQDCGEVELTRLWKALAYRPRGWVFGHFHHAHQVMIEGTRFVSVSAELDAPDRSLVIWDTDERQLLLCPLDPSAG